jgi:hypothetical protein
LHHKIEKKTVEELDMKKGMKYIIKIHRMLIEKEKVRDLHIFLNIMVLLWPFLPLFNSFYEVEWRGSYLSHSLMIHNR